MYPPSLTKLYPARQMSEAPGDDYADLVSSPDDACPDCGEDRIDYLVWDDDGEFVTCASCGCVYVP